MSDEIDPKEFPNFVIEARKHIDRLNADNAGLQAEHDELKSTYKLMSDAGQRAILLWREAHPDRDIWPDQAANMVWLMEQYETARKFIAQRTFERDQLTAQIEADIKELDALKTQVSDLTTALRKAQNDEANASAYASNLKNALAEVCELLEADVSRNVYLDPDDLTEDTWHLMNALGCPAINAALAAKEHSHA